MDIFDHEGGHLPPDEPDEPIAIVEVPWEDDPLVWMWDASLPGGNIFYRELDPLPAFPGEVVGIVNVTADPDPVVAQDENLSPCIFGVLKQYFSNVDVGGTLYNALGVTFSPGLPAWATALNTVGAANIWAVTYGVIVHFDTDKLPNLSKPTWQQFQVMVEEIVHVNQFLDMWADSAKKRKQEGFGPPSYHTALVMWKATHLAENAKKGYKNNPLEIAAQLKAKSIRTLEEKSSPFKSGPCGP